jgi:hypothetical protein
MRNVADKNCRENQDTHFMFKKKLFFFENRAVHAVMCKNIIEPDRPQMAIWRIRIAAWIPTATNTHSEYVILIAFPPPQWLQESASLLLYTHIACIVQPRVFTANSIFIGIYNSGSC